MKILLSIFPLLLLINNMPAQTGQYIPEMEALDESLQNFMDTWNIPGASLAVAKNGRLVYARGFGYADLSNDEMVQPYSRFRIASISKPLTAAAIFYLIEAGQLSLNDQVFGNNGILNNAYFLPIQDELLKNITIKHLLTHTAGWQGSGILDVDPMFSPLIIADAMGVPPPAMQNDIVAYMATTQDLGFSPGAQVEYANFGYCVLGRVIEAITGQPYEEYLQEVIFAPLGATSLSVTENLLEDRQENEVVYYHPNATLLPSCYGTGEMVPSQYGGINMNAMDAHGGWIATPTDLLRVALAIDGQPDRPDILSASSVQSMRTPGLSGSTFGHGWTLYGGGIYHFGLLPGSTGELDLNDGSGVAFAVLLNSHSFNSQFLNSVDAAIWGGLSQVTQYPEHDLFDNVSSANVQVEYKYGVDISPNPSEGIFTINLPDKVGQYFIYDFTGKLIMQGQTAPYEAANFKLDLSEQLPGTYIIELHSRESVFFDQIIKI